MYMQTIVCINVIVNDKSPPIRGNERIANEKKKNASHDENVGKRRKSYQT